ncbi:AAA family ATPase, partial [Streptomyces sp. NPDC059956]
MRTDTSTTPERAVPDPATAAAAATEAILANMADGRHRAVVVDSPPGAGKSTLVARAALELAEGGERPIIVAQTNNQVDDLVMRLAREHPGIAVGRLSATGYAPSPALGALTNTTVGRTLTDLAGCRIIVGTAAKWATVRDATFGWAILDEAYQMRSDMLLQIVERFERGLFVGDPGQLDPFAIVGTERWIGLPHDPTQNGVSVMLEHNQNIPVHRLPVSWRLPLSAAPTIARAFYPFT